jgi:hypothetical protein
MRHDPDYPQRDLPSDAQADGKKLSAILANRCSGSIFLVADFAYQLGSNVLPASLFLNHPRAQGPWRTMTDMLRVAAR